MKTTNILAVLFLLLLSSCSGMNKDQQNNLDGTQAGTNTSQSIGHNSEAQLLNTANSGTLGYIVGNTMDRYDREQLNHVYERGVSGQTASWINPDRGTQYQITPQPAYIGPDNRPCRKAEITAIIDGKTKKTYTTACRDDNGHWQLQQ